MSKSTFSLKSGFQISDRDGKIAVMFHKIPAVWEDEVRNSEKEAFTKSRLVCKDLEMEKKFIDFFQSNDIYYHLMEKLVGKCDIDELHIVFGFKSDEKRNWRTMQEDGHIQLNEKVHLWRVSNLEDIFAFTDADLYFMRGTYPHLHGSILELCDSTPLSIFYPATSQFYPSYSPFLNKLIQEIDDDEVEHEEVRRQLLSIRSTTSGERFKKAHRESKELLEMDDFDPYDFVEDARNLFEQFKNAVDKVRRERNPTEYSFVLYDEPENEEELKDVHPHSVLLRFRKPASKSFRFLNHGDRKYDFVFSATPVQRTKNHALFMAFLDFLEENETACNILFIGDTGEMPELTKSLNKKRKHVLIDSPGFVEFDELVTLYNDSRSNLIFSGRDCNPRVIAESMRCGCHNISLDILSDGISLLKENPILGTVIKTNGFKPEFRSGRSISLVPDIELFHSILNAAMKDHNHFAIGLLAEELLKSENAIEWYKIKEQFAHYFSSTPIA